MPDGHLQAKPIEKALSLTDLPKDWKIKKLHEADERGNLFAIFRQEHKIWRCKKRCKTAVDALFFIERVIAREELCAV